MNTRFVVTTKSWFGGGADLTPVLDRRRTQDDPDTVAFHAAMRRPATRTPRSRPMRNSRNGATIIFISSIAARPAVSAASFMIASRDDLDAAFAFTKAVGLAFLAIYPELVAKTLPSHGHDAEREEQLVRRGHYVEFNLLYDRGTIFGLRTDGNVDLSCPRCRPW